MSSLFTGEYNHTIDTKGRLIVPSKLREELGDKFIITKGLDDCLFVYPKDEWDRFEEKLKQLSLANKNARKFVRFFSSGACECELDKQGRILITPVHREFAGLEKDVVTIGASNRVEIWSKERWDAYNNDESFDMDEIAEQMQDLGI